MEKDQQRRPPMVERDGASLWRPDRRHSGITRASRMKLDNDHSETDYQSPEYDRPGQLSAKS